MMIRPIMTQSACYNITMNPVSLITRPYWRSTWR